MTALTDRPVQVAKGETAWMERGLCRSYEAPSSRQDIFYPELDESGSVLAYRERVEEAKAICRQCPVWRDCLTFALRHYEPAGIWGGLTVEERQGIRRVGQRQRLGTARQRLMSREKVMGT